MCKGEFLEWLLGYDLASPTMAVYRQKNPVVVPSAHLGGSAGFQCSLEP